MTSRVADPIVERRSPAAAQVALAVEEQPVAAVDLERFHPRTESVAELGHVARQDALQARVGEMQRMYLQRVWIG
jgi:hypothetical protein